MALRMEIVPGKAVVVRRDSAILAASWSGSGAIRPHVYPFIGPGGRELTRLGHPLDPVGHSHHRSIWIGHHDVSGVSFWEESPKAGRIEQTAARVERAEGKEVSARLECAWNAPDGKPVLLEKRGLTFIDLEDGELALEIDCELRPAGSEPATLGDTPFGLLGIRVAATMRVAEGLGGLIQNSQEAENEAACFWQHAEWCDYSGPVPAAEKPPAAASGGMAAVTVGIACFDHPANSPTGSLWHVRDDGWMGPCISNGAPRSILPGETLRARYRIEGHRGRPGEARVAERYRAWRKA